MKAVGLFALSLLSTEYGSAQEVSLEVKGDTSAVVMAALEWYAARDRAEGHQFKTLVVSNVTEGWTSAPPGATRTAAEARGRPRAVEIPQSVIARLETSSGLPVEVCGTLDLSTNSLCDIQGRWLWVTYDLPSVIGERARMTLDIHWLEFDRGGPVKGSRHGAKTELILARVKGEWTVFSSHPAGVTE